MYLDLDFCTSFIVILNDEQKKRKKEIDKMNKERLENALFSIKEDNNLEHECYYDALEKGY